MLPITTEEMPISFPKTANCGKIGPMAEKMQRFYFGFLEPSLLIGVLIYTYLTNKRVRLYSGNITIRYTC